MSRRAKIVATLGPATASQQRIVALIGAGLAGSPPGSPGKTNALRVHRIGTPWRSPAPDIASR